MSSEVEIPEDLYFTEEHEWVKIENSMARIGISDYAQDQLVDVVFVELPEVGKEVEQAISENSEGSELGTLESVKAVSTIYAPLSGRVKEVNERLEDEPELINSDPYEDGWLCVIEPSNLEKEVKKLLDSKAYEDFLESQE